MVFRHFAFSLFNHPLLEFLPAQHQPHRSGKYPPAGSHDSSRGRWPLDIAVAVDAAWEISATPNLPDEAEFTVCKVLTPLTNLGDL
jgi:hypothetical protein